MFLSFLEQLRTGGIPASLKEHLTLLEAMRGDVIGRSVDEFYYLSRAIYVKDETALDRFDRVFAKVFRGIEAVLEDGVAELPEEWLRKLAELHLSPEEMEKVRSLGSWEEIMETLKQRLEEQKGRHEGGSKWIGTGGTSPFGANGYNPEGVRIGQAASRHRRAVKVWDKREFRNLDDTVELGTRNIKIALRRLRRFARTGAAEEVVGFLETPDAFAGHAEDNLGENVQGGARGLDFVEFTVGDGLDEGDAFDQVEGIEWDEGALGLTVRGADGFGSSGQ